MGNLRRECLIPSLPKWSIHAKSIRFPGLPCLCLQVTHSFNIRHNENLGLDADRAFQELFKRNRTITTFNDIFMHGGDVFIQGIGAYAAKRGLRPGMRILSLQGEDTQHLPLHKVKEMLAAAARCSCLALRAFFIFFT